MREASAHGAAALRLHDARGELEALLRACPANVPEAEVLQKEYIFVEECQISVNRCLERQSGRPQT